MTECCPRRRAVSDGIVAATGHAERADGDACACDRTSGGRSDAGKSECKVEGVAAVERKALNGSAGDGAANGGAHGFDLRGEGFDSNDFGDGPDFKADIDAQGLVDL